MRVRTVSSLLVAVIVLGAGAARAQPGAPARAPIVERPIKGDLGMSFIFSGLATMGIGGEYTFAVNRAFFTEVGMKYMIADKWALPFSFGVGLLSLSEKNPDRTSNDFGLSFTMGFQRYFRVWRRIAPFFGAKLHLDYTEPTGSANYTVRIALGPSLGMEYFIADRVSLQLEYNLLLVFAITDPATAVGLQTIVAQGGLMGLNFYF